MPQTIHLVRHGEAVHNLGEANLVLPDTDLTPLGEEQARGLLFKFPELANVDLIVSSPLRRTLQTTLLAFPTQLERGLQIVAFSVRNMVKDVDKAYMQEGKWAPAIGSLMKRAEVARQWLSEKPDREIVVVSHGGFLHFLTDDWVNVINPHGTDWANAEVRSYTISHDEDEGPILYETRESREKRGVEPVPPTREEQLEMRQAALKAGLECGLIRP